MNKATSFYKNNKLSIIVLSLAILTCLALCLFVVDVGIALPAAVIGTACLVAAQISFIQNPKLIIWTMVVFCFTFGILGREVGGFPYGILQEGIMLLGWLTLMFTNDRYDWSLMNNDLVKLLLIWFIFCFLEAGNPEHASLQGWLQEIRAAALYPLLVVPMAFLLVRSNKDLNTFIYLILGLSLLASINGLKQLYVGPSPGEQRFLDNGGAITHILWGKLRVFSFYSDAGQFGASQAHLGLVAFILCLGPFKFWKKLVLFIVAIIMIYGMLISGTRGALFALVVGGFLAIAMSKKFKVIIIGGFIAMSLLFVLKYTTLGNNNYQIFRLRSAFDPKEASLNVRLTSQRILREYLSSRPIGGGMGVIGVWGETYNADKFLSTIQPDSYWVKLWAMCGIVGFTLWFCIMLYILGKCCGIIWNIKDEKLKIKALALTAGFAGILFCSYGNEVINTAPSSFVVYFSWVFVFIIPSLEQELETQKIENLNLP